MENIVFRCLVVEDDPEFANRLKYFQELLLEDYKSHVDFKMINDITDLNFDKEFYDILLIDYDLSRISSKNGDEIIKKVREMNKIIKIIFYSSQFIYDEEKDIYYFHNFPDDKIFKLINTYHVNKLIPRENLSKIVESIYESCMDYDLTILSLYKTIEDYYKKGISVNYRISDEVVYKNEELINEIRSDSEISKEIREKIIKFSINNIFCFEY